MEPLDGIAEADAHLGRRFPLPVAALPLVRWVDVVAHGPQAVEVAWSLDDTREGTPGRLALFAGTAEPPARTLREVGETREVAPGIAHREAPLPEAQASLKPVHELTWQLDGLHLRLTGQGPWVLDALVQIAASVE